MKVFFTKYMLVARLLLSSCCCQVVGARNTLLLCNWHFALLCTCWARIVPAHWLDAISGERESSIITGVKTKFSDFPTLPRGWKSELEKNLRSSEGQQVCPPSLHCHLPSKSLFAAHLTPGSQGLDSVWAIPIFSCLLSCSWFLLQHQCECLLWEQAS